MDASSKIPEIEKELERIDVELLMQEHRPTKIFSRLIRRKQLFPNSPSRQSAVVWAAISSLVFSPTTVAVGGGFAAFITVMLMYWQTSIMADSNRIALSSITPVDRVAFRIEEASISPVESPFILKVTFSNEGTQTAYIDDLYGISLHAVTPGVSDGPKGYYAIKMVPENDRVLEPKTFKTINFHLVSDDVGFATQEPRKRSPSEDVSEKDPINYPVVSNYRLDSLPKSIDSSFMLHALLRISVKSISRAEYTTACTVAFSITGSKSGMQSDDIAVGYRVGSGGVWPSGWASLSENGFDTKSDNLKKYSELLRLQATMPTFSQLNGEAKVMEIPLDQLGEKKIHP